MPQSSESRRLARIERAKNKGPKGFNKAKKYIQQLISTEVPAKAEELEKLAKSKPEILWNPIPRPPVIGTPPFISVSNAASEKRLRDLVIEKYRRQREPLKLYRPLAQQRAFHESQAFIRLAVGSNRSGKTLISAVELSRAVLNCDPYRKYPAEGMAYVVGKSLAHIADTIYRKLCKPGFLRIIQREDGDWEVFQPWRPDHWERRHESKPSGPLIPKRFIKRIKFEDKGKEEISSITFSTGWTARFFSARGLLPQGAPADLVWLDEEIVDSQDGPWVPEMIARLTDNKGRLMWSATPQNGFANLLEMSDKADRQLEMYLANPKDNPKPDVVRFDLRIEENAYQDKEAVDRFRRSLSEDEAMVRFGGMSMANSIRVYPEWSLAVHGIRLPRPLPKHWTRYAIVDPGSTICAVLFCAVPPPEESPCGQLTCIAYDELYMPQCNAAVFAAGMHDKTQGYVFEAFLIDGHGARPTEAGSGLSIETQYSRALESRGVFSVRTKAGFLYGNPDRAGGILRVHEFLMSRQDGQPRFRIAVNPDDPSQSYCPMLHMEMVKYRKQRVGGVILDTPHDRGPTHLCQCVRYICSYDPQYVEVQVLSAGYKGFLFKEKLKKMAQLQNGMPSNTVNFGSGR